MIDALPDVVPVLDRADPIDGLFISTGFSGHGFQQSPAVGRILAELITGGQTSFDISPFRLERFEEGEVVGEKRVV